MWARGADDRNNNGKKKKKKKKKMLLLTTRGEQLQFLWRRDAPLHVPRICLASLLFVTRCLSRSHSLTDRAWLLVFAAQVSYIDLSKAVPILAIWLADVPKDMLEIMDEVCVCCGVYSRVHGIEWVYGTVPCGRTGVLDKSLRKSPASAEAVLFLWRLVFFLEETRLICL